MDLDNVKCENVKKALRLRFLNRKPNNEILIQEPSTLEGLVLPSEVNRLIVTSEEELDLSPLSDLPSLTFLGLMRKRLSTKKNPICQSLPSLPNIQSLWLAGKGILGDLSSLHNLPNLNMLTLGYTNFYNKADVEDFSFLSNLENLRDLSLIMTNQDTLDSLKGVNQIEMLSLTGCYVADLDFIDGMTDLKFLCISGGTLKDANLITDRDFLVRLNNVTVLNGTIPPNVEIIGKVGRKDYYGGLHG